MSDNFETNAIRIQSRRSHFDEHSTPLYLTSSFVFEDAEDMRASFAEEKEKNLQKMYGAIHQLNEIDKALIFYYLQDFSGKEMAEQLGLSEGNARIKLNRAKNKLKELLT